MEQSENRSPCVSVIVPVYNGGPVFAKCLQFWPDKRFAALPEPTDYHILLSTTNRSGAIPLNLDCQSL
jgi:hypothetical protein